MVDNVPGLSTASSTDGILPMPNSPFVDDNFYDIVTTLATDYESSMTVWMLMPMGLFLTSFIVTLISVVIVGGETSSGCCDVARIGQCGLLPGVDATAIGTGVLIHL